MTRRRAALARFSHTGVVVTSESERAAPSTTISPSQDDVCSRSGVVFCFGDFEYQLDSGELHRHGRRVRLQPQPAKVLELLARRSGEVVARRELQQAVWGELVHVDFEEGLNYCVKEIRRALGDSVRDPRYVETVPRRGYRFLGEVRIVRRSPKVAVDVRSTRPVQRLVAVTQLLHIGRRSGPPDLEESLREELIVQLGQRLGSRFGVARMELARLAGEGGRGAAHLVVEGSVRSDAGGLEVNLRLLDIEHNAQLLAQRYRFEPPNAERPETVAAESMAEDLAAAIDRPAAGTRAAGAARGERRRGA